MGYDILPQFCQRLRHIEVVVGQLFPQEDGSTELEYIEEHTAVSQGTFACETLYL